jgi:serine/threonine protein kinase
LALFELHRLHKLGFIHGDLHKNNILIDPNGHYFDDSFIDMGITFPIIFGKSFIIDFGLSKSFNKCAFPDGLDPANLQDWSIADVIKMELFNVSQKLDLPEIVPNPDDERLSTVFPGRSIRYAYFWMEKYLTDPKFSIENDNTFPLLYSKRQTMIEKFVAAIPPDFIQQIDLLKDSTAPKDFMNTTVLGKTSLESPDNDPNSSKKTKISTETEMQTGGISKNIATMKPSSLLFMDGSSIEKFRSYIQSISADQFGNMILDTIEPPINSSLPLLVIKRGRSKSRKYRSRNSKRSKKTMTKKSSLYRF